MKEYIPQRTLTMPEAESDLNFFPKIFISTYLEGREIHRHMKRWREGERKGKRFSIHCFLPAVVATVRAGTFVKVSYVMAGTTPKSTCCFARYNSSKLDSTQSSNMRLQIMVLSTVRNIQS